jgi:hypothetical protein
MEVYSTKGFIIMYPLPFFAIMLILLNGYASASAAAAVLVETNTTFRCDGRLDECLLEDDLQFEFLMNPYVSRVLAGNNDTPKSEDAIYNQNKSVFPECSTPNYKCSATPGNPKPSGCNIYGDQKNRNKCP